MLQGDKLLIGVGDEPCYLLLNQANRHGLIAGASGTGKTVTMKQLAQGFSQAGVPVFMADAKGDVSGMCEPGTMSDRLQQTIDKYGLADWTFEGCPTRFWSMLGGEGIPVRIRVSDMGPTILSRLLQLSDAQEGVLNIAFHVADDMNLLLIDLKDLRAMLTYISEHADDLKSTYGLVSTQSVAAIQRNLLSVEDQGGNLFFGEPALDLADWMQCDSEGYGYVNVLDATKLINSPQIYAMFLLWMMSELFDTLPEVGDPDKPRFVFFFDEAHLLFNGMPQELLDKIVQVVKLIRSKGVGMYFITQSPSDIPDNVLAQLSNRIQHGLRAYTPGEQKAVRAAAAGFRENPAFDSVEAINELGTGEALISCLDDNGMPSIVQRAAVLACQCSMNIASDDAKQHALQAASALQAKYGVAVDPQSAYEDLEDIRHEQAEGNTTWYCPTCKVGVTGKFCSECGTQRPDDVELADTPQKVKAQQKAVASQVKEQKAADAKAQREAEKTAKANARMAADIAGAAARMMGVPSSVVTAGKSVIRNGGDSIVRGLLGNLLK